MDEWKLPDWEHNDDGRARRIWDPDSGGWILMFRDSNGAFSAAWKPDGATWANAIGAAVAKAKAAA